MAAMPEICWLVVYCSFAAFGFGWGTGSNDVANAFGTSVGSKTLTLTQAVIIAAIFEFTGALLLGRVNTETIASGIANIKVFGREPEIYAYGMCTTLLVGTIWQGLASYWSLNVSSTHSIIGGIIGFSLVFAGADAVKWSQKSPDAFPPYKGVVSIVLGWFIAPVIAAIASASFFLTIRTFILRRKSAYTLAFWLLPPLVLITVFVSFFFVLTKGARKTFAQEDDSWTDAKSAWIAICVAAGFAVVVAAAVLPLLKKRIDLRFESDGSLKPGAIPTSKVPDLKDPEADMKATNGETKMMDQPKKLGWAQKAYKGATHGMNVDIHAATEEDKRVHALHEKAEIFSPRVEFCFSYLQVFSAICVIFAHGAGEVGYMAGPLATVYAVYQEGKLPKEVKPPVWIIFIGASGLVIGLATYGYNVTRAMGVSMCKLTPSRGFCAELATAFILLLASQYGLPTSSSTTIVGAIVGVGLCEGTSGVNWALFGKQFCSWVVTMLIMGLGVAALFSQAVYAPSITWGRQVTSYEDRVAAMTNTIYRDLNSTIQLQPPSPELSLLTTNLTTMAASAKKLVNSSATQTVSVNQMFKPLYQALALVQNYTIYDFASNATTTNTTIHPHLVPSKYMKTN